MKILIISGWGGGTALGDRLVREGHQVKMYIKPHKGEASHVGDGFIEKVKSIEEARAWADFFIFDDGQLGKISEALKKDKKIVWGGSDWSDEIELDRGKGQKTLKEIGMTVSPSHEFSNLDQGIAFVQAHPGRYVVKPSGPVQDEKALTYCGKEEDGSDLIVTLQQYKEKWSGKITKFELQEFQEGIEVGISGFFTGKEFVDPIEISFEHKKLMPGNIGPASGEMGTSMVWMGKRKIYRESIGRMVKLLAQNNYTGYIDINCIATEKILYPLEFTTRFGYPTIHLKMETIKGNMGQWMYKVAKGERVNFPISAPYSICVVVATPPYPFDAPDLFKKYGEGQQVIFSAKDKQGIWPGEIVREKGEWFISGSGGFSVICTGSGKSIEECQKMAYKRVESFTIPNSFWRNDIGAKTEEQLKTLNRWGWFAA